MRAVAENFSPQSVSGFVVLEGVNGAGKTTLQSRIAEFFESQNQKTILTREPGSTALGKTLRTLVLEDPQEAPCDMAELFLFAADRAQHVEKVIKPGTASGAWVISDRYFYSTVAFQGYGRGIDQAVISQINKLAIGQVLPDLVFLLDLDPASGLKRTQSRSAQSSSGSDKFEKETLQFHNRIRQGFLKIAEDSAEPFAVLDASRTADQILESALPYLEGLLRASRERKPT